MLTRCLVVAAVLVASPFAVRADVPGAPPAVPPECPPGTHLEGPYRYWSCVPDGELAEAPTPNDPLRDPEPPRAPEPPAPRDPPPTPEMAPVEPPEAAPAAPPPAEPAPAEEPVATAPDIVDEPPAAGCACRAARGTDRGPWVGVLLLAGLLTARHRKRG